MIEITGEVTLKVRYKTKVAMSAKEFEALSEREQNKIIEGAIDWVDATRSAETDEVEVWDVEEI